MGRLIDFRTKLQDGRTIEEAITSDSQIPYKVARPGDIIAEPVKARMADIKKYEDDADRR
jgi:hypothetical protein